MFKADPFQSLDQAGVGLLITSGIAKGRASRAKLKVGICGEHGGDSASVKFCHRAGMDYVSASPFRVPVARLAAAQAALEAKAQKNAPAIKTVTPKAPIKKAKPSTPAKSAKLEKLSRPSSKATTSAKKAPAKKTPVKKTAPKKIASKTAAKAPAIKVARKTAVKKTTPKKTVAKKPTVKKSVAKKRATPQGKKPIAKAKR